MRLQVFLARCGEDEVALKVLELDELNCSLVRLGVCACRERDCAAAQQLTAVFLTCAMPTCKLQQHSLLSKGAVMSEPWCLQPCI